MCLSKFTGWKQMQGLKHFMIQIIVLFYILEYDKLNKEGGVRLWTSRKTNNNPVVTLARSDQMIISVLKIISIKLLLQNHFNFENRFLLKVNVDTKSL